jgi:hypothetical protein
VIERCSGKLEPRQINHKFIDHDYSSSKVTLFVTSSAGND